MRGRPAGLTGSERLHRIYRAVPIVQDHSREGRSSGPELEDHVHPHPGPRRRSGERDRHPRLERIVGSAGHGEQGAKQECDKRCSAAPEGAAHRSAPAAAARQASRNEATWIDAPSLSPGDARGRPASSRRRVGCTDPRTPGIRAQARGEVSMMSRLIMASRTASVGWRRGPGPRGRSPSPCRYRALRRRNGHEHHAAHAVYIQHGTHSGKWFPTADEAWVKDRGR